ncbi:hypothetical protein Salat_1547400 [Sesamum alatum]|uniref:DUF7788 domain-containing protein n=1 Tax=Sesamum alatum TaxID=300844 RepID=A0AAE1YCZ5_9LAMI|nr:hypothetical protein Salat_1547400 [Sesamum alatum]
MPMKKGLRGEMVKVKEEMEKAGKFRNAKTLETAKRATERFLHNQNVKAGNAKITTIAILVSGHQWKRMVDESQEACEEHGWRNLSKVKKIKRLFDFNDMEFNEASTNRLETDYMAKQSKFREDGHQNVPEIVFWNLRNSPATHVTATQNGVAFVLEAFQFSDKIIESFRQENACTSNYGQNLIV